MLIKLEAVDLETTASAAGFGRARSLSCQGTTTSLNYGGRQQTAEQKSRANAVARG
jgi:hypothetical protein